VPESRHDAKQFKTAQHTYIVLSQLRCGSSGSTYVVRRVGDTHEYVLKELSIAGLKDWKYFDLFEREVQTLKDLHHPRIPAWIDSHLDEDAGTFVHVQTKVEGQSLASLTEGGGTLSSTVVEEYLRQALEVLDYIHGRVPPVIHRDITPTNIMVGTDGIHLIDFGAVKVGQQSSTSMTTVGTFGYMAPEQILGRADARSDLYGLGMTCITLATGCSPRELPQDPRTGLIDPTSVLRVEPHLNHTLLALIRPGIDERPQTARAALAMLDEPTALQNLPTTHPGTTPAVASIRFTPYGLSPYQSPEQLSEADKMQLRGHGLQHFPAGLAVFLHFISFGLFSLIHYGMQHERLPKVMVNDPTPGKAIGFSFIPYFNLYWIIFNPLRLADRINLQSRIRDQGDAVPRGLILACGILSVIPYINIVFGLPLWGAGVYSLQTGINRLAAQAEQERASDPLAFPEPRDET
jgi:hypothetical protein